MIEARCFCIHGRNLCWSSVVGNRAVKNPPGCRKNSMPARRRNETRAAPVTSDFRFREGTANIPRKAHLMTMPTDELQSRRVDHVTRPGGTPSASLIHGHFG